MRTVMDSDDLGNYTRCFEHESALSRIMENYVTLSLFFVSVPLNGNSLIVIVFSMWCYGHNLIDIYIGFLQLQTHWWLWIKMECTLDPFVALRKDVYTHNPITCKFAVLFYCGFEHFLYELSLSSSQRDWSVCVGRTKSTRNVNMDGRYLSLWTCHVFFICPCRWQLFTHPLSWMDRQLVFVRYMDILNVLERIHPKHTQSVLIIYHSVIIAGCHIDNEITTKPIEQRWCLPFCLSIC